MAANRPTTSWAHVPRLAELLPPLQAIVFGKAFADRWRCDDVHRFFSRLEVVLEVIADHETVDDDQRGRLQVLASFELVNDQWPGRKL